MPTGYTMDIKDGITFKDFVWRCARAFGAFSSMIDKPFNATIPDKFQISDYHDVEAKKSIAELIKITALSDAEAEKMADDEYNKSIESNNERIKESENLISKYRAMLENVYAWVPPTLEHEQLKDFMISQIKSSIECDDMTGYYKGVHPVRKSGETWRLVEINRLKRGIESHQKEYADEVHRINNRNEWISQLRESLKQY